MDELDVLEAQQTVYVKFGISPKALKPCIGYLMVHNSQNKMFNVDDYAYLIATELRRTGQQKEKTVKILQAWNNSNSQALKPNELNGLVQRAYSKDYSFGCNNSMLVEHCPGRENCSYYKALFPGKRGRHRERYFYKYGWQHVLKSYEVCLYDGVKELERRLRSKPGDLIVATYRHIHDASGRPMGQITQGLTGLEKVGLIRWQKGQPFRWQVRATEIRRVIPIPRPKNDAKMHRLRDIGHRTDKT